MRGTRVVAGAMLSAIVVLAGCGSADSAGSDEDQVFEVVTEFQAAMAAGDGETACADLTAKGQRSLIGNARGFADGSGVQGCEAAVGAVGAVGAVADYLRLLPGLSPGALGEKIARSDVYVNENGRTGQANCKYRGAILLRKVDGAWLIDAPGCVD
jgi:hypothetical protein